MRWSLLALMIAGCSEAAAPAPDLAPDLAMDLAMPGLSADLSDGALDLLGPPDLSPPATMMVYVSGYSPQIARFTLDPSTGALGSSGTTAVSGSPSFLAVDPAHRHLYALDEATTGTVRAFAIDAASGALTAVGAAVSSGGNGPAHLSVDPQGQWVLVANYGDGSVSVLPIHGDGSLGAAADTRAAGMNAHMILADESDTHVFVPCKGANYLAQYDFAAGQLTPNTPATVAAPLANAGPRHILLRAGFAYVIEENDSKVTAYTRDGAGHLTFLQSLSTLRAGFSGTNTGAELAAFGNFLYGSNRGDDSIAQFTIGTDGKLTLVGVTKTGGMTPRSFTIDPSGRWLLVANQNSNELRVLSLDATTGAPSMTAVQVTVPSPSFVGVFSLKP